MIDYDTEPRINLGLRFGNLRPALGTAGIGHHASMFVIDGYHEGRFRFDGYCLHAVIIRDKDGLSNEKIKAHLLLADEMGPWLRSVLHSRAGDQFAFILAR